MTNIALLRWITLASILFWLALYWQGGRKVIIDIKEALQSKNSRLDAPLLIIMALCSLVIISIGLLTSLKLLQIIFLQNPAVVFAGTLCIVLGIIGMFYCRYYLGKFWTAETNVSKEHKIIDTGPYRLVRHPIYTFAILMYIGSGLVFLSQWTIPFAVVIIAAYILKTKDEDLFLEKNLPGYREYKLRVRYRLLPGLW
jgi:protein-S-isoprenylcysteine O-methyltransferase Ste14